MAEIIVRNLSSKKVVLNCESTILEQLHQSGTDWMHACGGKGRCTTCKFQVVGGDPEFSEPTTSEIQYFEQGRIADDERLACQTKLNKGTAVVSVPESSQLPHLTYTE